MPLCRCALAFRQDVLSALRSRWGGLHPLSTSARAAAAALLQPLAEAHEALQLLEGSAAAPAAAQGGVSGGSGGGRGGPLAALHELVARWSRRAVGVSEALPAGNATAGASGVQTVLAVRQLLLRALSSGLGGGRLSRPLQSYALEAGQVRRRARGGPHGSRFRSLLPSSPGAV